MNETSLRSRVARTLPAAAMLLALLTSACGSGDGSDAATASAAPSTASGRITLAITDAVVDEAAAVVVEFTGVEIKAVGNGPAEVFDFEEPRQIDLLALEGGGSEILLDSEMLPAGDYEWIRLKVNAGREGSDSYVDLDDGSRHALFIPSGNQTGLKLVNGFTVAAGREVDFTIDFDLRRSVIKPPGLQGLYLLKPALRLVDNIQVGTIEGEVAAAIAATDCTPAVYVYQGFDAEPDDLGSDAGPYVTAAVKMDEATGAFEYRVAFVPAGDYTVALTCDALDDDPEADDEIEFVAAKNATVKVAETTIIDFPAT